MTKHHDEQSPPFRHLSQSLMSFDLIPVAGLSRCYFLAIVVASWHATARPSPHCSTVLTRQLRVTLSLTLDQQPSRMCFKTSGVQDLCSCCQPSKAPTESSEYGCLGLGFRG